MQAGGKIQTVGVACFRAGLSLDLDRGSP